MAHVMVDAEDLLDDDNRAARLAARIGAVGGKSVTVRSRQFDRLSHIRLLLILWREWDHRRWRWAAEPGRDASAASRPFGIAIMIFIKVKRKLAVLPRKALEIVCRWWSLAGIL